MSYTITQAVVPHGVTAMRTLSLSTIKFEALLGACNEIGIPVPNIIDAIIEENVSYFYILGHRIEIHHDIQDTQSHNNNILQRHHAY